MKRLIQTNFEYDAPWGQSNIRGSYLGRKPATLATIRRFMRTNNRIVWGEDRGRYSNVRILGSFESPWVAK